MTEKKPARRFAEDTDVTVVESKNAIRALIEDGGGKRIKFGIDTNPPQVWVSFVLDDLLIRVTAKVLADTDDALLFFPSGAARTAPQLKAARDQDRKRAHRVLWRIVHSRFLEMEEAGAAFGEAFIGYALLADGVTAGRSLPALIAQNTDVDDLDAELAALKGGA